MNAISKGLFLDNFGIVAFNKIAHTPVHIVLLSSVRAVPKCDAQMRKKTENSKLSEMVGELEEAHDLCKGGTLVFF